jgi:hypothetical protein
MTKEYKALPSAEDIWAHFDLELWTGRLIRKHTHTYKGKLGYFGSLSSKGYLHGKYKGTQYYLHRLVWLWVHAVDPALCEIDHIDRVRTHNTPWNLRTVNGGDQSKNTKVYRNNRLGVKGVRKIAGTCKYAARIRVNGALLHLGCFATVEEASAAYRCAASTHFGELASTAPMAKIGNVKGL